MTLAIGLINGAILGLMALVFWFFFGGGVEGGPHEH